MPTQRLFTLWAALSLAVAGSFPAAPARGGAAGLRVPERGALTGAYLDAGDTEDTVTARAITDFEGLVAKPLAIVASSSYWGRDAFPAENVRTIRAAGSVPLIYWSPWGPPYDQHERHKPDKRFGLDAIAAGALDGYLDRWADGARDSGGPLLVSFGNEMNADWFPWSGPANGGDKANAPERFKAAWRHVVARVRERGATNVQWVFQANATSAPAKPWNAMAAYYPGAEWVDWLGLSVYGQLTPGDGDEDWVPWADAMDRAYAEVCRLDPARPVMLAEWGVGEFPRDGDKGAWLREAFSRLARGDYPRLKAAVFWHERWQNGDETWSNLRADSSPGALRAYREGVADPFWLARPAVE